MLIFVKAVRRELLNNNMSKYMKESKKHESKETKKHEKGESKSKERKENKKK